MTYTTYSYNNKHNVDFSKTEMDLEEKRTRLLNRRFIRLLKRKKFQKLLQKAENSGQKLLKIAAIGVGVWSIGSEEAWSIGSEKSNRKLIKYSKKVVKPNDQNVQKFFQMCVSVLEHIRKGVWPPNYLPITFVLIALTIFSYRLHDFKRKYEEDADNSFEWLKGFLWKWLRVGLAILLVMGLWYTLFVIYKLHQKGKLLHFLKWIFSFIIIPVKRLLTSFNGKNSFNVEKVSGLNLEATSMVEKHKHLSSNQLPKVIGYSTFFVIFLYYLTEKFKEAAVTEIPKIVMDVWKKNGYDLTPNHQKWPLG